MSKYSEEPLSRIGNAAIYIAEHTSDLCVPWGQVSDININ